MDFLITRLREPSTWAGLAGVIGGMAFIPHATDIAQTVAAFGVFIGGLLSIWLPEKKA